MKKVLNLHQLLVSNEVGGAAIIGLKLAKCFTDQSYRSHLWIPGPGAAQDMATQLGLVSHLYDARNILSAQIARAAFGNLKMWHKLRRYGPGIVHIYSPLYYSALRYGVKFSGLKTVVHVHIDENKIGLARDFSWPPDAIVTCAKFLVESVRSVLPTKIRDRQTIVALPNAVDNTRFRPDDKGVAKRKIGANTNVPLLLMVANLAPHKGQETAIRALSLLKDRQVEATLWLAGIERGGTKDYTNYLRFLCRELYVTEEVRFLGQRNDIPQLLRAADVFLLPSTAEGLPLSVLEAQATKIPVIAAPTAGIPEIIDHGQSGFLIPASDWVRYADNIHLLLKSPSIYQRIAEQGYKNVITNHNWATYCDQVSALYKSLMEEEKHPDT